MFASCFGKTVQNKGARLARPVSIRYTKFFKKFKPLKMAVVWGTELNFPDSLLIFVLYVIISSFRELAVTSVSASDDRRCLHS